MTLVKQALIFAAGEAKRMRPLTDDTPKPLLPICNQSILTQIIDHLLSVQVTKIIINGYYKIAALQSYITDIRKKHPQCEFILSKETDLLETGGGAVNALPYMTKGEPIYMINGDAYWCNASGATSLELLQQKWGDINDNKGLLLLIQPLSNMPITQSIGDYDLRDNGRLTRNLGKDGSHMFAGIRICFPDILNGYDAKPFSFLQVMDDAQQDDQLYGLTHNGLWFNINTPDDYDLVNNFMTMRAAAS